MIYNLQEARRRDLPDPAAGFPRIDDPADLRELLGIKPCSSDRFIESLPFAGHDTTAGSETELQVAVAGLKDDIDLPITIEQSNYFANIMKRAASGEAPLRLVKDLERFLGDNPDDIWENSWVRLPRRRLSPFAGKVFERDLLADKGRPCLGRRRDTGRFIFRGTDGEEQLRLPISYLLKLSLADMLGSRNNLPPAVKATGERLMGHFLNDNTSPETFSFHVTPLSPKSGMGRGVARETGKRYLLTQLLVMYANECFGLRESGQEAIAYLAPHPPVRQQELNSLISDSFYRDLFMSPCLSGWDRGEEKHRYMQLCHQVLSRSQLNSIAKLREAGIIINNLVVLPTLSNVSLANNGTHVSLGSRKLGMLLADPGSGYGAAHEKKIGDLVIKMVEHFLPLFVGTYSAAPYRLSFTDFHPEKALGFLPHELDYTHLRMIWRRWKKKASLSLLGHSLTPFGPEWLDGIVSGIFRMKGDFVPDFRLIDYLVCLLSTNRSPALDGALGNCDRLRNDLTDMGVFDCQMSVYLLYKLREFSSLGFSGFEGRHYSLFESMEDDLGGAVDIQTLVTALAFKYMAEGKLSHAMVPDNPSIESERRQIFFGAAIGIPTFYVKRNSGNAFLGRIISRTNGVRMSRRYPGYLRVTNREYCRALLRILMEDGAGLIESLNLMGTMEELMLRLEQPERYSATGKLTGGVLRSMNVKSPMDVRARDFNRGAERFYRSELRRRHTLEAFAFLEEDCRRLELAAGDDADIREAMKDVLEGNGALNLLQSVRRDILGGRPSAEQLRRAITLLLIVIHRDTIEAEKALKKDLNP